MCVLDIGANIGELTAVAADCVGSSGRVIAFEPSPDNVRQLRERFGGVAHVDVRHAAVSDRAGSMLLHLDAENAKRHSLYPEIVSVTGASVEVPVVRLDDVVREIPHVNVIKIDAQGAEGHILAGARSVLARDRPVVVFELWPAGLAAAGTNPREVFASFDSLGYRCVRLSVKGRQKPRASIDAFLAGASRWASTNVIAWPPDRPAPLWSRVRRAMRLWRE
jgi:FkbM family methyltransferase